MKKVFNRLISLAVGMAMTATMLGAAFIVEAAATTPGSDNTTDAYELFLGRENRIVEIINELGGDATAESLEYNINFLKDNYDLVSALDDADVRLVDWYIEDMTCALEGQNFPSSAVKPSTRAYSATNAVTYANTYYSSYNSAYPDWTTYGGDCANFVSQCLKAGGKAYNVAQTAVTAAKAADWANWYSYGSALNTTNVSSTHRGANAFRNYWQSKVSYNTYTSVSTAAYNYGSVGDAISLLTTNDSGAIVAYHTLFIIGKSNNDFTIAAHTSDTNTKKLSAYAGLNSGFIIYKMA
jgi:hypothetical protein